MLADFVRVFDTCMSVLAIAGTGLLVVGIVIVALVAVKAAAEIVFNRPGR